MTAERSEVYLLLVRTKPLHQLSRLVRPVDPLQWVEQWAKVRPTRAIDLTVCFVQG